MRRCGRGAGGRAGQPIGEPVEWAGAQAPRPRAFEGRAVRLEPLTIAHAPDVVDVLGSHPELWTYQATGRGGAFVGRVFLLRIQPGLGSIEVGGIIYAPALQRTRAATEAQYLQMQYAFDDLSYRRYEWKCEPTGSQLVISGSW